MVAKKGVSFYAAKDVAEWLANLPEDENVSLRINEAIREGALKPKPKSLFQVPLGFYQMNILLNLLKEEEKRREKVLKDADPEDLDENAYEYVSEVSKLRSHLEQFVKE